eukprot:2625252-Rhodomonas_salina.1
MCFNCHTNPHQSTHPNCQTYLCLIGTAHGNTAASACNHTGRSAALNNQDQATHVFQLACRYHRPQLSSLQIQIPNPCPPRTQNQRGLHPLETVLPPNVGIFSPLSYSPHARPPASVTTNTTTTTTITTTTPATARAETAQRQHQHQPWRHRSGAVTSLSLSLRRLQRLHRLVADGQEVCLVAA